MSVYSGPTAFDLDRLPAELKTRPQWVLWRGADRINHQTWEVKLNKIPIDPQTLRNADTTDPATWGTFEQCVNALPVALEGWQEDDPGAYRGGGIGFVFAGDDPYAGVDLDHCRDPDTGAIADWAQTYITTLASYAEVTPSGTGLHSLVHGALPPRGRKKGPVEMYDTARFFTMTGWHLDGTPTTIEARQSELTAFHAAVFGVPQATHPPGSVPQPGSTPLLEDTVILDKAHAAQNGAKFAAVWNGDTSAYAGDDSAADMALCNLLAFWTEDAAQIDRLFRQSGLMRDKWDAKHGAQTYGELTIGNALAFVTTHYQPPGRLNVSSNGNMAPQQTSDAADAAQLAADALLARLPTCAAEARCDAIFDALPALVPLDTLRWVRLKHQLKAAVPSLNLPDLERARNDLRHQAARQSTGLASGWQSQLLTTKAGDPIENVSNIALYLEHHHAWSGAFWWDTVRSLPMVRDDPLSEPLLAAIARWLGTDARMSVRSLRLVEHCVIARCHATPRDLLQEWLHDLPAWDTTPRLRQWLSKAASIPLTARLSSSDLYCMDVSRLLIVSMVARALDPGCLYRNVVILEGPENSGKSTLVRTLASPDWYVELSNSLEGKEGHMLLQGAWLAELAELDALSKTEETRLKAFITLRDDAWIPKYSNQRTTRPRRTIFVGTTNERSYLRGLSGNTRFLPIKTGAIDLSYVAQARDQLFAEALDYYHSRPTDWWQLSTDGEKEASTQRDARRTVNVYEAALSTWLESGRFDAYTKAVDAETAPPSSVVPVIGETTWVEIAEGFLKLDSLERWKDIALQKQIASALRALGWELDFEKSGGKTRRFWGKVTP